MGDLTDRNGRVSVFLEPGRHTWWVGFWILLDGGGPPEKGVVAWGSIAAGQECVTGSPASGGLNIVTMECDPSGREAVDVWGLDVVGAEAFQFWSEIVDANEEDGGGLGCGDELGGEGAEKEAKGDEVASHVLLLQVKLFLDS